MPVKTLTAHRQQGHPRNTFGLVRYVLEVGLARRILTFSSSRCTCVRAAEGVIWCLVFSRALSAKAFVLVNFGIAPNKKIEAIRTWWEQRMKKLWHAKGSALQNKHCSANVGWELHQTMVRWECMSPTMPVCLGCLAASCSAYLRRSTHYDHFHTGAFIYVLWTHYCCGLWYKLETLLYSNGTSFLPVQFRGNPKPSVRHYSGMMSSIAGARYIAVFFVVYLS